MTRSPQPARADAAPGAPRPSSGLTRRSVLAGGTAVAVSGLVVSTAGAAGAATRRLGDPFTLGVASGDPSPHGFVLWTRLAVDPLAEDGLGGMPDRRIQVDWQVATDERFRKVVRSGRADAQPAAAHSIHLVLGGLEPASEYFYQFKVGAHTSPVGRTRTAPAWGGSVLNFAVASCAQYEHGWFTAYRRIAEEELDLVVQVGDYLYEYEAGDYVAPSGNVRNAAGPETTTLAGYRQRHAQYKADPDLQAAHQSAPWAVVFDDHEVENNWADDAPEEDQDPVAFKARRAAAFQAYYENMPLRRASLPSGADIQVYRRLRWGSLAQFHLLDTRQYRSDQALGDGLEPDSPERNDPARSITGDVQEKWLLDGVEASTSVWDIIGQQVFMAKSDYAPGPAELYNMDAWDGYTASRDRILGGIAERGVTPVVLTGDIHSHWANELKADFADPASATIGVELVTTSITAGGDGADQPSYAAGVLAENPHVKFASDRRGYVRVRVDRQELQADYRVLPRVSQPGAAVSTAASFTVPVEAPGLEQVAPRT